MGAAVGFTRGGRGASCGRLERSEGRVRGGAPGLLPGLCCSVGAGWGKGRPRRIQAVYRRTCERTKRAAQDSNGLPALFSAIRPGARKRNEGPVLYSFPPGP